MDTIASFEVDHTQLVPGIYVSREDRGIVTYDLRFVRPNAGTYLPVAAIHTIEHLFAVSARNGRYSANIIYFGPMGCRTGFYLLTADMTHAQVIALVTDTVRYIAEYSGQIPGATEVECGNYMEHDLEGAKRICAGYAKIIENITESDVFY